MTSARCSEGVNPLLRKLTVGAEAMPDTMNHDETRGNFLDGHLKAGVCYHETGTAIFFPNRSV